MNDKPAAPAPAPKYKMPRVGEIVHFFDQTRAQPYAQPGEGPYAAIVTLLDVGGVSLQIFGPRGGNFPAERVPHRAVLDPNDKGRRKWWQYQHESAEKKAP